MTYAKRTKAARYAIYFQLQCIRSQRASIHNLIQTALQVYCQAYKQAPVSQAHGLLRKARRLDTILGIRNENQNSSYAASAEPEPECRQCHSQFSPAFYRIPAAAARGEQALRGLEGYEGDWMCHQCHFTWTESRNASMAMVV